MENFIFLSSEESSEVFRTLEKQPPEVFLKIYQNSLETICAGVSILIEKEAWGLQLY